MAQSDNRAHTGMRCGTDPCNAVRGRAVAGEPQRPSEEGHGARRQPSVHWLDDPRVFAVNRLPAHTDHMSVDGASGALRQSLDGVWRARVVPSHLDRLPMESTSERWQTVHIPPAFASDCFDECGYMDVEVPGCLETQGLMRPQYVNIQYPWDGHEQPQAPHVPDDNLVALYRRTFDADPRVRKALSAGERVSLTFDGAATAIYVWLNGAFVGYAEDSYTPSEFDVTDALGEEGNTLAVACFQYSSASWLEDQDCWRFHGLFRGVRLDVRPCVHVRDMQATADWDVAAQCGVLDLRLALEGDATAHSADVRVCAVDDEAATPLWEATLDAERQSASADDAVLRVRAAIADVRAWSAEEPNRYRVDVLVYDADGQPVEISSAVVGFRHVEIERGIFTVNGERVVLRGVNRHEFDARYGRSVTEEDMLWDVRFMKRHNINAVRTSHYPNQTRWLELCDEYGIYMIDEANLETHGSWNLPGDVTDGKSIPGDDPMWLAACVDRVQSMVARDRNHACVVAWSLGNESYAGTVIEQMGERCRAWDPTRPVHYEGVQWNLAYSAISDFESRMYARPDDIRDYLEHNPTKPYISCEYMHAMGNSLGGLSEYTALERYPHYQGGFIWDFIDQALWQRLDDGTERLAYGGDFGDRPSDMNFSGDGIVFADRTPSAKAEEVKAQYAPVRISVEPDRVLVHNGNAFVGTGDSVFVARMLVDGREVWSAARTLDVPAGETRALDLVFPPVEDVLPASGDSALHTHEVVYEVSQRLTRTTAWAEAGHELAWGQCTRALDARALAAWHTPGTAESGARVTLGRWNGGMRLGSREMLLSRTQGGIVSMRDGAREMVSRVPRLITFRPLTDNDRGASSGFDRAQWFGAGRYARVITGIGQVEWDPERGELTGEYWYELADDAHTTVPVRYSVDSAMRLHVEATWPGEADATSLPLFGLEWALPVRYSQLEFYGPGPWETYADRDRAKVGAWRTTAFDDVQPYLVPQETGNHAHVRWARVTDEDGHGLLIESTRPGTDLALSLLPYDTLTMEAATHQDELPKPRHMFLRMLAGQMGVGGDDSWGAPVHDRYQLDAARELTLDVTMLLV